MRKVSVIIRCFNSSELLYRCWESVKKQTLGQENIECIFVDDASCDGGKTWEMLQCIEKESPANVIVIHLDENKGPGGAANVGIVYVSGKYFQLLDSDDELTPDALEKLYGIAEENNAEIIQYNHTIIYENQKKQKAISENEGLCEIVTHADRIPFLNSTKVTYGCTNKFYLTEFVKEIDVHFAENMVYEEPLFVYPMFLYATRVYLCNESFYMYHLHEGSIVTSKIGRRLLDHPNVQLMLLEDCMRREIYKDYEDVVSCYFLWTFYCETILFAGENQDAVLPIEFFKEMQVICRELFPNWRDNPCIQMVDRKIWRILETIDNSVENQAQLEKLIGECEAVFTG